MKLHSILSLILLLLFVIQQSKAGEEGNRVPEDYNEFMGSEPTPPPEEERPKNPPKVWRRKRDTNQSRFYYNFSWFPPVVTQDQ
jgi:hypothetical protein